MTITITDAAPEDALPLAAILVDWARATPWMPDVYAMPETRRLLDRLIATRRVWVARQGTEPVGFVAVDGAGYVDALYLCGAQRGRGIGSQLLDRAKAAVGRQGLVLRAFAEADAARRFYRRAGFAEVGGSDGAENDAGLPDVRLEWRSRDG